MRNSQKGISILEILIYITIITLLMVVVVNTAMVMTIVSSKARLKQNILGEGGVSLERIVREIRLADSVDLFASTFGIHPGVLKLNTIIGASDDTPITREFYLASSTLMMKEGGAVAVPFIENTSITRLVFYYIDTATTSKAITIEMTVEDTVRKLRESHTFYTTSVLRRSY